MLESLSNENYLDSKNHKLQSSNKFELEQNIITSDPNVVPNGLVNNNLSNNINNNELQLEQSLEQPLLEELPILDETLLNEHPIESPSVSNNLNSLNKEENTPLTNLLNEVAGSENNKVLRKNINELKKLSNMPENVRNNNVIFSELMEVFPISIIVGLIIFILLLIYVLGFKG